MDFRQRFHTKLSKAIELSGEEVPISKEIKSSQMHDTNPSSFRSSAYSVLSQQPIYQGGVGGQGGLGIGAYVGGGQVGGGGYVGGYAGGGGMQGTMSSSPSYPSMPPSFYPSPTPQYQTPSASNPQWQQPPTINPPWPQPSAISPQWQQPASVSTQWQTPAHQLYPQHATYQQYHSPSNLLPPIYPSPQQCASPLIGNHTPVPKAYSLNPSGSHSYSMPHTRSPQDHSDVPWQLQASRSTETMNAVSLKKRGSALVTRKSALPTFKAQLQAARKAGPQPPVVREVEIPFSKKRDVDYSPYTYEDYLKVKRDSNQRLGGLGPVNVNTKEWKDQTRRRIQASLYGKLTRVKNAEELYGAQSRTFDF